MVLGKEDLDLGPNDLHLDDFLLSGKFDLIAYADPELNLEDKKDMFNEELDLGEPLEGGAFGSRKTDSNAHLIGKVKPEVHDGPSATQQPTSHPGLVPTSRPPGAPVSEAAGPGSARLKSQEEALSSGMAPRVHPPLAGGNEFYHFVFLLDY